MSMQSIDSACAPFCNIGKSLKMKGCSHLMHLPVSQYKLFGDYCIFCPQVNIMDQTCTKARTSSQYMFTLSKDILSPLIVYFQGGKYKIL